MDAFRDRLDLARLADELARAPEKPDGGVSAFDAVTPAMAHDRRPRHSQASRRPIPIRTVPRAAIEALVARLTARGFQHVQ